MLLVFSIDGEFPPDVPESIWMYLDDDIDRHHVMLTFEHGWQVVHSRRGFTYSNVDRDLGAGYERWNFEKIKTQFLSVLLSIKEKSSHLNEIVEAVTKCIIKMETMPLGSDDKMIKIYS